MLTIPLIRTEDDSSLTPIERTALACEQVITALMMHSSIDTSTTDADRELYTTLSVATIVPAEA